jgi:hypothetical protein
MEHIEGAERIHGTVEAVLKAETQCVAAASWFFPVGAMSDDERARWQAFHADLERIQGELRKARRDLATLMGEAYRSVRP